MQIIFQKTSQLLSQTHGLEIGSLILHMTVFKTFL